MNLKIFDVSTGQLRKSAAGYEISADCVVVTDEASWNQHLQELLALFFFLVVLKDFLEVFSGWAVVPFGWAVVPFEVDGQ